MKTDLNIDLYFLPLHSVSRCIPHIEDILATEEIKKVQRYINPDIQARAIATRMALRLVLSKYSNISPKEWVFTTTKNGKPHLCFEQYHLTNIEFNLSHSGDWLLIGVTQFDGVESCLFGVDIERSRPKTDIYPILNNYFSPHETSALLAIVDEASQRQRFFDLWALKESYIKATGLGLAQSLKSFAFELKPFEQLVAKSVELRCQDAGLRQACGVAQVLSVYPNIPLQPPESGDPWQWQTHFGRLTEEYRFAVSLAHTGSAVLPTKLTAQLSSIATLLADNS